MGIKKIGSRHILLIKYIWLTDQQLWPRLEMQKFWHFSNTSQYSQEQVS